jgi:hypothetical protein
VAHRRDRPPYRQGYHRRRQNDAFDRVAIQIHDLAQDAVGEDNEFVEHHLCQALDLREAVSHAPNTTNLDQLFLKLHAAGLLF